MAVFTFWVFLGIFITIDGVGFTSQERCHMFYQPSVCDRPQSTQLRGRERTPKRLVDFHYTANLNCAMMCLITESGVDRAGHRHSLLNLLPPGNHRAEAWSYRGGWRRGGEEEEDGAGGGGGGGGAEAPASACQDLPISSSVEMLAAAAFFLPGRMTLKQTYSPSLSE